jgi:DNA repair exonuclease SbcCD ATPase subunit
MINHLITKLEELEQRKKSLEPKIKEINNEREQEIQKVKTKYDHIIADINYELKQIENGIYNEIIESFVKIITRELEVKRSSSLYSVTDELKEYRTSISQLRLFPEELIEKLDKVINGNPVEDVIYVLDDIKAKYLKE